MKHQHECLIFLGCQCQHAKFFAVAEQVMEEHKETFQALAEQEAKLQQAEE